MFVPVISLSFSSKGETWGCVYFSALCAHCWKTHRQHNAGQKSQKNGCRWFIRYNSKVYLNYICSMSEYWCLLSKMWKILIIQNKQMCSTWLNHKLHLFTVCCMLSCIFFSYLWFFFLCQIRLWRLCYSITESVWRRRKLQLKRTHWTHTLTRASALRSHSGRFRWCAIILTFDSLDYVYYWTCTNEEFLKVLKSKPTLS